MKKAKQKGSRAEHRVLQQRKTPDATGPAIDETVRKYQTPGWKHGAYEEAGLANNVVRTATLGIMPEDTLPPHHQAPPEGKIYALTSAPTLHKATHSYTQPSRGEAPTQPSEHSATE